MVTSLAVFNDRCVYFPSPLKMYETETPQSIQELSKSIYIPRGTNMEALGCIVKWDFTPTDIKVYVFRPAFLICSPLTVWIQFGDYVSGGSIFGRIHENSLVDAHKVALNPRAMGTNGWTTSAAALAEPTRGFCGGPEMQFIEHELRCGIL